MDTIESIKINKPLIKKYKKILDNDNNEVKIYYYDQTKYLKKFYEKNKDLILSKMTCDLCNKDFSKNNLNRHNLTKHHLINLKK